MIQTVTEDDSLRNCAFKNEDEEERKAESGNCRMCFFIIMKEYNKELLLLSLINHSYSNQLSVSFFV